MKSKHHDGYTQRRLITLTGRFDSARFSGSDLQVLHVPLLTIKVIRWEERDKRLVVARAKWLDENDGR